MRPTATSNFYYVAIDGWIVTNLLAPDGLAGCFRCAFVWRARSLNPKRCPRCKSRLWDVPKLHSINKGSGLGIREVIGPKREELFSILRENRARNPRVFGSVARSEGSRTSDLDLLVDFDPEASIFDQIALLQDLEGLFERKVDVVEPGGLHWLIRPQVLFEAAPI
ncbi:MAG: nucleotidyltransferase domain-containing protein [Thermoplasmata archaeon]